MKRIILAVLLVVAVGVGAGAYYSTRNGTPPAVSTALVSQGPIVDTVSATGTVQAVTTVQVGTQVSGTVSWLGADFNSVVRKGQVIARLDPSLLDAQRAQSEASLTQGDRRRRQRQGPARRRANRSTRAASSWPGKQLLAQQRARCGEAGGRHRRRRS